MKLPSWCIYTRFVYRETWQEKRRRMKERGGWIYLAIIVTNQWWKATNERPAWSSYWTIRWLLPLIIDNPCWTSWPNCELFAFANVMLVITAAHLYALCPSYLSLLCISIGSQIRLLFEFPEWKPTWKTNVRSNAEKLYRGCHLYRYTIANSE